MQLSATAVKAAKPGKKPYKMSDKGGLYLLVQPSGSRLWRYDYRFAGKRGTLALGRFPDVSLTDARTLHEEARKLVAKGISPTAAKRALKTAGGVAENSFEVIARRWFAARERRWEPSYATRVMNRMEADLFPHIGSMSVESIEPPKLLEVIRKIEARGAIEAAKRINNYAGEVFQFALAEGRCDRDPSADIKKALAVPRPKVHRAALKESDLPGFLAKLDSYSGEEITKLAIQLTLLTVVRTSETRFARWEEFEYLDDPARALWRIPPSRMKMKQGHLVPLSPGAVSVIRRVRTVQGDTDLLFESETKSGTVSENRMLYAAYGLTQSKVTIHGFRRTFSTWANERHYNSDVIERALAHVETSEVRAAYNAAEWLPQRRELLRDWSDFLDAQLEIGRLVG